MWMRTSQALGLTDGTTWLDLSPGDWHWVSDAFRADATYQSALAAGWVYELQPEKTAAKKK